MMNKDDVACNAPIAGSQGNDILVMGQEENPIRRNANEHSNQLSNSSAQVYFAQKVNVHVWRATHRKRLTPKLRISAIVVEHIGQDYDSASG